MCFEKIRLFFFKLAWFAEAAATYFLKVDLNLGSDDPIPCGG
jgi:hypothetical protein